MQGTVDRFEVNQTIIPLYMESAQTFLELGIAALALTVIFREKILGEIVVKRVPVPLLISWLSFLVAIGASGFYQYLAVKFLDHLSGTGGNIKYFKSLVLAPGRVYGVMLVSFFTGALFLVWSSVVPLIRRHREKQT